MESVDEASEYDWADDENLDLAETERRFEQLEPALVVVTPPETWAGSTILVTTKLGAQQPAATFA